MSNVKDQDYDYVEVTVSKKIAIPLSVGEGLAVAQKRAEGAASAAKDNPRQVADRAGLAARLGQRVKDALLGRGQSTRDSG